MCSGKTHATIGLVGAELVSVALNSMNLVEFSVADYTTIGIGAVVGSLIVDIDSKKSKASQMFNRCLIAFIVMLVASRFVDLSGTNVHLINLIGNYVKNSFFAILLIALTVVSHLSPHRMFTHKVIGTLAFSILALLTFNLEFAFAFLIGYVLHLVADGLFTKEDLRFLEIRLPMQDSRGKFHPVI